MVHISLENENVCPKAAAIWNRDTLYFGNRNKRTENIKTGKWKSKIYFTYFKIVGIRKKASSTSSSIAFARRP